MVDSRIVSAGLRMRLDVRTVVALLDHLLQSPCNRSDSAFRAAGRFKVMIATDPTLDVVENGLVPVQVAPSLSSQK